MAPHEPALDDDPPFARPTTLADFLLEQTRGLAANPDMRLVASIAGGRKTMGALLYACLTLLGRDDDRLTHVLVNDPFETLPGFFFPTGPDRPWPGATALRTRLPGRWITIAKSAAGRWWPCSTRTGFTRGGWLINLISRVRVGVALQAPQPAAVSIFNRPCQAFRLLPRPEPANPLRARRAE